MDGRRAAHQTQTARAGIRTDGVAQLSQNAILPPGLSRMHVVSRKALVDFWTLHRAARSPMAAWFKVVSAASFTKFADVKRTFNSADRVGEFVVFDVGAGYRIITAVHFNRGLIYVRHVLTHPQYDRWTTAQRGKR